MTRFDSTDSAQIGSAHLDTPSHVVMIWRTYCSGRLLFNSLFIQSMVSAVFSAHLYRLTDAFEHGI